METVTVNSPTGNITIRNPFYSYQFQNYPFTAPGMTAGVLSTQDHTTRCPDADLVNNAQMVDKKLNESGSLKEQVVSTVAKKTLTMIDRRFSWQSG